MRKLVVFNNVTLDGYFTDNKGDMSWAHRNSQDPEFQAFTEENAKGGGQLVFGRITYDMMASYWPSAMAKRNNPVVAERMNALPKIVFSRTLDKAAWSNTTLIKDDPAGAVRKAKQQAGPDMVVFGSGSIVSQLAGEGLIDEYQVLVNPIALGKGRSMFDGVRQGVHLNLTKTRTFKTGTVFLCYTPSK